jgi:hypothetical protein
MDGISSILSSKLISNKRFNKLLKWASPERPSRNVIYP